MDSQSHVDSTPGGQPHSKAFKVGIDILKQELALAIQWQRPSILFTIHTSNAGQMEARHALEKETQKFHASVVHLTVDPACPDVILAMAETTLHSPCVFFVSGIENADQASNGSVYKALNIHREVLVERGICVVFWLNETEAANLPRLAPDFWAFRHRMVEFASSRGSKKQSLPAGLFLWQELIPDADSKTLQQQVAYFENLLSQLPTDQYSTAMRIEALLKLAQRHWLLNQSQPFSNQLAQAEGLLSMYPIPEYQAWAENARAISIFEQGDKPGASLHFANALRHTPTNALILMNAAFVFHGTGKNAEAILTGKKAIDRDPGNYQLWRALGYMLLSMGKFEDATRAMTKAQTLNPLDLDTCLARAICHQKNSQALECTRELARAAELPPDPSPLQLACIRVLSGQRAQATADLDAALRRGILQQKMIERAPCIFFLTES